MCIRRWLPVVALLVVSNCISLAQTSEWGILRQLTPGKKVQVQTADGKSRVGKVKTVTDVDLRIGRDEVIQRGEVQRVRLWSSGHHGRNALIGLGVGAGVGVGFGVGSCGGKDAWFTRGQCAAVSAPLFGGLGAAVGALIPSRGKWQDLYLAK
ncbi:hypothetical protein [Occallatibacter savannae]|uniref:hypothetical protein n=1 Tax=Occallatibacter savannae TaxID=1002691 RepID=UPI000D69F16D|nr:hypothetical protein [Occallatibacter savannae]